jgi:Na+/proline symporter
VVSAVFTNDIYKGTFNPHATDRKLMKVARLSSWMFGLGMIGIALVVPYIGGIVELTLSIGAITGGPLLAPPIWALFSKRLTGKATIFITVIGLAVNLLFKIILPFTSGLKLSRANEMLLGVLLPFFMLLIYEIYTRYRGIISDDYVRYQKLKKERREQAIEISEEEAYAIKKQNKFGLHVISFSLFFIALLLYILSGITIKGGGMVAGIATLILFCSAIPFYRARRIGLAN